MKINLEIFFPMILFLALLVHGLINISYTDVFSQIYFTDLRQISSTGQVSPAQVKKPTKLKRNFTNQRRLFNRYQEFLLTLVKLRLALTTFLLGDLFGISTSRVSPIFTTWINYMALVFTPLLKWPSQDVIKRFRPRSFAVNFPNLTGIIDCTEFFINKTRNPTAKSQTFSSYKQHNTFKALVCISPSGAITSFQNCGVVMYLTNILPRNRDSWTWSDQGMKLWQIGDF